MKKFLSNLVLLLLITSTGSAQQLEKIKKMVDLKSDRTNLATATRLDSTFFQNIVRSFENRAFNDKDFTTLNGAIDTARTATGRLLLSDQWTVSSNLTIDVESEANSSALLTISTSRVNITKPFSAGRYQLFNITDTSKVVFSPGAVEAVFPEWFGMQVNVEGGAALQKAFDSIRSGRLLFGPANYLSGVEVFITNSDSNITISGFAGSTVLKRPNNDPSDNFFNFSGKNNITIQGITFDVNQTNQTATGIRQKAMSISSANNLRIQDCVFVGGDSIHSVNEMVNLSNITNMFFKNNLYQYSRNSWVICTNVDGAIFDGNIIEGDGVDVIVGTGGAPVPFSFIDGCSRISVSKNIIDMVDAAGIYVDDPDQSGNAPTYISATGNIITNTYGDNILFEQGDWLLANGNIISGNHPISGGDSGISLGGFANMATSNIVEGKKAVGIPIFYNSKVDQHNLYKIAALNIVHNNGDTLTAGSPANIWLDDQQRSIVGLNLVGDSNIPGGTSTQSDFGIRQSGSIGNNIIIGNGLFGNQTNASSFASSDYVVGNVDFNATTSSYKNVLQLSDINPNTFGGHLTAIVYHYDNVLANLTNVDVPLDTAAGTLAFWQAPKAGSIIALTVRCVPNRSAGTMTINARDESDGEGTGISVAINGTNLFSDTAVLAKDAQAFAAGERLYVEITTDASWAPTTADITITLLVEM